MRRTDEIGRIGSWRWAFVAGAIGATVWLAGGAAVRADDVTAPAMDVALTFRRSDHPTGDGLAMVPSPLREALEAFVDAEFAFDRPITPEAFATGFVEAFAGRAAAPVVHRLSIDDDPDSFDAALAAYSSGICTDAFEEDFGVDAVPKDYLIRDGKIVEQGIVDEAKIASWHVTYAP